MSKGAWELDEKEKQYNRIKCVLDSCLNWQECASLCVGEGIRKQVSRARKQVRERVRERVKDAGEKITFLQDALIYSLRIHLLEPYGFDDAEKRINTKFDFYEYLANLLDNKKVEDEGINVYFYGLAIAKLFRAHMATRCGGTHGLAWGSDFTYPNLVLREKVAGLNDLDDLPPRERKNLLAAMDSVYLARKSVFLDEGWQQSDAITLAGKLMGSARMLVELFEFEIKGSARKEALRAVIVEHNLDHESLLEVWRKGVGYEHGPLPMDKLWKRSADCAYKNCCIEYDEFVAITIKSEADPDDCNDRGARAEARKRAEEKLKVLERKEKSWQKNWPDWINVVKNWWCRGFMNGIYRWKPNRAVDESLFRVDGSLCKDARDLMELVNGEKAYEKVQKGLGKDMIPVARVIVRVACEGGNVRNMSKVLRGKTPGKVTVYAILFLVAITVTTPKLQDCWKFLDRDQDGNDAQARN